MSPSDPLTPVAVEPSGLVRRAWVALPWLLAGAAGLAQIHGAQTSGHLMWLGTFLMALALLTAAPPGLSGRASLWRAATVNGFTGLITGVHLWGIAFYSTSVYLVAIAYHVVAWAIFGALFVPILRWSRAWAPLSLGALWALIENLRSLGSFSFPFYFGGMLASEPPIAQGASVVGASGLSCLLVWIAFAAAGQVARLLGDDRLAGPRIWLPAAGALLVAWSLGALRLSRADDSAHETLSIVALQGAVPSWMYSLASGTGPYRDLIEEHYGILYRKALALEPDVILFPETTFAWHLDPSTEALRRVRTLSAQRLPPETWLLVGASFRGEDHLSHNGVAIASGGRGRLPELRGTLTKRRLVPFIEAGHQPAERWTLAQLGKRRVGVMVCYESMYPQAAAVGANAGADLLTVLSDDAGMRASPMAWTHAEQGRMRAIEQGLPLIRNGQVGPTYAVDAYGRSLGEVDHWATGNLAVDVPLNGTRTVYRSVGMLWTLLWLGLAFVPAAVGRLRSQRRSAK